MFQQEIPVHSVGLSVCRSVCSLVTSVNSGENGKLDRDAVWGGGSVGASKHVLDGVQIPPRQGTVFGGMGWRTVTYREDATRPFPKLLCDFMFILMWTRVYSDSLRHF